MAQCSRTHLISWCFLCIMRCSGRTDKAGKVFKRHNASRCSHVVETRHTRTKNASTRSNAVHACNNQVAHHNACMVTRMHETGAIHKFNCVPRVNGAGENTWHIYNVSAQDAPLVHTPAEHAYWNMTAWARFCEYTLSRWNETINYVCKHKSPQTWPPPNVNMRLGEKSCAHMLVDLYACTCST